LRTVGPSDGTLMALDRRERDIKPAARLGTVEVDGEVR
jgi:hypothetical protein